MNTCIIAIAKNNHADIKEWVDYYFNLGIDHIFLFDNNEDAEHGYHFLMPNITIIPYYNLPIFLNDKTGEWRLCTIYKLGVLYAYDYNYDWCFIVDIDEYLTLYQHNNIKDFILSLCDIFGKECTHFSVMWKTMSDSGYLYIKDLPKNKTIYEIYTEPIELTDNLEDPSMQHTRRLLLNNMKTFYNVNMIVKLLFRDNKIFTTKSNLMHNAYLTLHICSRDIATLHHIRTQCLEKFLLEKTTYSKWRLFDSYLLYYMLFNHARPEIYSVYVELCNKYNILLSLKDEEILNAYNQLIKNTNS